MKGDQAVQDRIRQLLDEEFQVRVEATQERLPVCCVYNYRHTLDSRKMVHGQENTAYNRITRGDHRTGLPVLQTMGLCMYGADSPEEWPGTICEDPVDAKRCPPQAFTPRVSPDQVKQEFEAQIKDLAWVKKNLPEVNALLWVLGTEKLPEPTAQPSETVVATETAIQKPASLPWWKSLILRLMGLG